MRDNREVFQLLFKPQSIAVIGASSNNLKPGGRVLKNIKDSGYSGHLWPVNPKSAEIMDLPAYADIGKLPQAPDLALIAIPAPFVLETIKALGDKGTRAVIILTAGFGETGEKGKAVEKEILALANEYEMTVVGPNCSGFLTPEYAGKFAGIIPKLVPGKIDFVSGSGATVDYVMEGAVNRGLQFSTVVNMGNSIQTGVEDILELLDENHGPGSSKIILLYMEAILKPKKLLKHVRSLTTKGCTFVGIKSGVTTAGAKAAASHTGAMATSDNSVQALFDKAGIIRVSSKRELIEAACALSALGGIPRNNRACIITDAGGPGVMLTDELNHNGITVPTLKAKTIERLKEILPAVASFENPIDCLPSRNGEQVKGIFDILCEEESENIDFAFFLSGNSGMSDNWDIYREIVAGSNHWKIPVLPVFSSATTCAELLDKITVSGTAFFYDEVAAGHAVCRLVNRPLATESAPAALGYNRDEIAAALTCDGEILGAEPLERVLKGAGFKLPLQAVITDKSELDAICEKIGYPVVMKVVGPLHKSDVGGVKVGIRDPTSADKAWDDLMKIPDAEGVFIQKMVSGVEVIMGAVKEEEYGHLVMFGLGGIYTEVLKDVQFSLAPLNHEEALTMIQGIRSFPILEGVRGETGMSLDILADYLVRLSLLVNDFPEIREIDLNPVKGEGEELYVVDARLLKGDDSII
jgi:acyl-CoA synthetase (NDP forming)